MSAIVESEPKQTIERKEQEKPLQNSSESNLRTEETPSVNKCEWANEIISNITLNPLDETDLIFKFTLSGLNVSLANALRRTIQDDIPTYVFNIKTCNVEINTGRLHNEILKHRLECIPIHSTVSVNDWLLKRPDHNIFEKYIMELDVKNDGEQTIYVTTADFKIKNKSTGRPLTSAEMERLFPKNRLTNSNIIFARLRPRISETMPGEHLKLSCEFMISSGAVNSAFTAVCCSVYGNTIDSESANKAWESTELRLRDEATKRGESINQSEIEFQKKNFNILDRQRYFVTDSFDFNIESVGVYEPRELCRNACIILQHQFDELAEEIDTRDDLIHFSDTTMANSFDFVLEHNDYTIGKVLEFYLYDKGFVAKGGSPKIAFCGFKKMHPHDEHSIIRVSYNTNKADKSWLKNDLKDACKESALLFKALSKKF